MSVYSKNLTGQRGHMFVANTVAYSTYTTFSSFIDSSSEGQIGVFLASGALQTTALNAGDQFFIAQKRDGYIHKTPILNWSDVYSARLDTYVAPVTQVYTLGYNGTSSTTLGLSFATVPVDMSFSVRNTTPGNQPFPVQEGYAVATATTDDQYTRVAQMVAQFNEDFDYENAAPDKFAYAEIRSNGAITELTANPTCTQGSRTVTLSANQTIATGAFVIFNDAVYKVTTGVTAGTTIIIDRPFAAATVTIDVSATVDKAGTIAYTSGTTLLGIRITASNVDSHFVVTALGNISTATTEATTAWKLGTGYGPQVQEIEKEQRFFNGIGSPINAPFAADYGLPTLFATASATYDMIFLDLQVQQRPSAASPVAITSQSQKVMIAAPTSTTPSSDLQAIFGV